MRELRLQAVQPRIGPDTGEEEVKCSVVSGEEDSLIFRNKILRLLQIINIMQAGSL